MPIDAQKLLEGDTLALSRAITLVESTLPLRRREAIALVDEIYDRRKASIRLGITGIPGVGKSTFIENLGLHILSKGLKLAVLAVDPSSAHSGGSILGDKTRMEDLSKEPNAFIRPSPSSGTLGGVAARTRESMLLCEAAGFDVIIIETVGVGQSETEVINITDCFLMLAMPGTGDDLQGIKRGIMEVADMIVINKADGHNIDAARKAKKQLEMALHLFPKKKDEPDTKVMTASALQNEGIEDVWKVVLSLVEQRQRTGYFKERRSFQQQRAFEKITELSIYELVMSRLDQDQRIDALKEQLKYGRINEFKAAMEVLESLQELKL